ncbi:tyrosine-type recombinase/integrase [Metaclostridioides mangenotii]|jgi:integrase/recombinase XerD|uniref:Integrase/recombinase XerD n=1 Tax=Metaclostridioides mangenotii TaxID=1540 RepID=A0ABS4E9K5_9FIRM|nr:tyrosine-type recombinase/integrase [Clostridioides mangenotii]MBP1854593.1 integrase/recombinase XerD [Clostridioides mangenotii]
MDVIEGYIDYIKNKKKLSENTVSSYFMDIKRYREYIVKNNIELHDIVENDIISFLIQLEKENISVATIARMISSIKSFHEYLFFNHICSDNPAQNMKKPKIKKDSVEILTEEEIVSLLDFPKLDTPKLIRDKAIFELLYGTGIRVSELVDMNLVDVNFDLEYIDCNACKNKRAIPLFDTTKYYLQMYINESRSKLAYESEEALFVSSLGYRFTRQGLWKIIKKYSKLANIDKNINPTMLRHSFAIHLLNKGANIGVVSKILGNSNLSSLQVYINQVDQNIRRELKDKHPRK